VISSAHFLQASGGAVEGGGPVEVLEVPFEDLAGGKRERNNSLAGGLVVWVMDD